MLTTKIEIEKNQTMFSQDRENNLNTIIAPFSIGSLIKNNKLVPLSKVILVSEKPEKKETEVDLQNKDNYLYFRVKEKGALILLDFYVYTGKNFSSTDYHKIKKYLEKNYVIITEANEVVAQRKIEEI